MYLVASRLLKGTFAFVAGEWQFSNRTDVTDQHKVTISEDSPNPLVVDLGDITENDQYRISYDVELSYEPVDGEFLQKNDAILEEKTLMTKP